MQVRVMSIERQVVIEHAQVKLVSRLTHRVAVAYRGMPAARLLDLMGHPGDDLHLVVADVQDFMQAVAHGQPSAMAQQPVHAPLRHSVAVEDCEAEGIGRQVQLLFAEGLEVWAPIRVRDEDVRGVGEVVVGGLQGKRARGAKPREGVVLDHVRDASRREDRVDRCT
eukprot:scaffold3595_cov235-Ochromonas_danica.AAC.31